MAKRKGTSKKEKPEKEDSGILLPILTALLVIVGIGEAALLAYIGIHLVPWVLGQSSLEATALPSEQQAQVMAPTPNPVTTPTPAPAAAPTSTPELTSNQVQPPAVNAGQVTDIGNYEKDPVKGAYVGSLESDKYHYPNCQHAERILPENEIWFNSLDAAKSAGYDTCDVCSPK